MKSQLRPALISVLLLTILTGILYPAVVTAIAKGFFPRQADGSLIVMTDGRMVGSELIGQPFTDLRYFWSRPSATSPVPYNATSSSGSNLGPTNPVLAETVRQRIAALQDSDSSTDAPIPVDLVTASGSGLDPHISIAAADYQITRIARARHIPVAAVEQLVREDTEGRTFGVLGEPRVNVLKLNLALDRGITGRR